MDWWFIEILHPIPIMAEVVHKYTHIKTHTHIKTYTHIKTQYIYAHTKL